MASYRIYLVTVYRVVDEMQVEHDCQTRHFFRINSQQIKDIESTSTQNACVSGGIATMENLLVTFIILPGPSGSFKLLNCHLLIKYYLLFMRIHIKFLFFSSKIHTQSC